MSKKFEEDKIDTEELKENVFNQGKWLRLLWIVLFSFIYWWAAVVLYIIGILQFLFNLFTFLFNFALSSLSLDISVFLSQMYLSCSLILLNR